MTNQSANLEAFEEGRQMQRLRQLGQRLSSPIPLDRSDPEVPPQAMQMLKFVPLDGKSIDYGQLWDESYRHGFTGDSFVKSLELLASNGFVELKKDPDAKDDRNLLQVTLSDIGKRMTSLLG